MKIGDTIGTFNGVDFAATLWSDDPVVATLPFKLVIRDKLSGLVIQAPPIQSAVPTGSDYLITATALQVKVPLLVDQVTLLLLNNAKLMEQDQSPPISLTPGMLYAFMMATSGSAVREIVKSYLFPVTL